MPSILLSQSPGYQPEVIKERIITVEEEVVTSAGEPVKPVPSFVYFVLAILLIGVAVWAVKGFRSADRPNTSLTQQVKRPVRPTKILKK